MGGPVVMFGGKPAWMENEAFMKKMGPSELVQWNGVTHVSKEFGGAGTLDDKGVGASIKAPTSGLTLTTRAISSSNPDRTHTVQEGSQLGINAVKSKTANFEEKDACKWTFDFDRAVKLKFLLFNGIDHGGDAIKITIEGGDTVVLTGKQIYGKSKDWSGVPTLRFRQFQPPIAIPAGKDITIEAAGSSDTPYNKFGLSALVVALP